MSCRPRMPTARTRILLARAGAAALAAAAVGALLAGCSTQPAAKPGVTVAATASAPARVLPPITGAADYQLGGAYSPPEGVTVVERDSTAKPAAGVYSICYVNGFQTQPGVEWPDDLLVHRADGSLLVDPGWPDEHLIDLSTAAKREAAAKRQEATIDSCRSKGFKAVEFDNLDSYSRSKGAFTLENAVAFATLLTARAHRDGLAAAQKNTAELASRGREEVGFDFAVTEECDRFSECPTFTKAYGTHVIDVEYTDDLRGTFDQVCKRSSTPPLTILRDRDLVARGTNGYLYRHC